MVRGAFFPAGNSRDTVERTDLADSGPNLRDQWIAFSIGKRKILILIAQDHKLPDRGLWKLSLSPRSECQSGIVDDRRLERARSVKRQQVKASVCHDYNLGQWRGQG
jgi:hypothetical protein